jgi:BASS family bile acid:Na+ symporter
MRPLAWIGRQGPRAIAVLVGIGIAAPPIGARLAPFVTQAIVILLAIAFARVDGSAFRAYVRRPALALAATAWTVLVIPATLGTLGRVADLDVRAPDLFLGVMLQAVASPMMVTPALLGLIGLDATLVLVALILASAVTPLTAPLFTHVFVGAGLRLSPLGLGLKLFTIIAVAAGAGLLMRWLVGAAAIRRRREELDGVNILLSFVFVAAVMQHVLAQAMNAPLRLFVIGAGAVAVFFAILGVTTIVFAAAGGQRALALGCMAAQRNMGLMLAATGGALPDLTLVYFAVAQLPIYLSPLMLKPLAGAAAKTAVTTGQAPN